MRTVLLIAAIAAAGIGVACSSGDAHTPAADPHAGHAGHAGGHDHKSPYAGQENQAIKALTDQEIAAYLNGEGMGLAKTAELNGYPGPKHVLEMKEAIALPADQEAKVKALFDRMKAEAVRLGTEIVEKEKALEASFKEKKVTAEILKAQTAEIERLKGELRNAHLMAHLEMMTILTPEQVAKYNELRGYKS